MFVFTWDSKQLLFKILDLQLAHEGNEEVWKSITNYHKSQRCNGQAPAWCKTELVFSVVLASAHADQEWETSTCVLFGCVSNKGHLQNPYVIWNIETLFRLDSLSELSVLCMISVVIKLNAKGRWMVMLKVARMKSFPSLGRALTKECLWGVAWCRTECLRAGLEVSRLGFCLLFPIWFQQSCWFLMIFVDKQIKVQTTSPTLSLRKRSCQNRESWMKLSKPHRPSKIPRNSESRFLVASKHTGVGTGTSLTGSQHLLMRENPSTSINT